MLRIMFRRMISRDCPFFSYMASRNMGIMERIRRSAAVLLPRGFLVRKYSGTPTAAATLKQMSCRLVRLNSTFVLTLVTSLGTVTYGI